MPKPIRFMFGLLADRFHQRARGSKVGRNHRCLSNLRLQFRSPQALSLCLIAIVLGAGGRLDGRPAAHNRYPDTIHNRTCRCTAAHSCCSVSWDFSMSCSLASRALLVLSMAGVLIENASFPAGVHTDPLAGRQRAGPACTVAALAAMTGGDHLPALQE